MEFDKYADNYDSGFMGKCSGRFYADLIKEIDVKDGDRESDCGGHMEPVSVWARNNGEWAIIHRRKMCGAFSSNRVAADDNPMKLMSIAMKPIGHPPFPLERIEEMTRLIGGQGSLE